MIWCYNGRVKRTDFFFTSDECGLTNRAFQYSRLSGLSVRSTQTLFSLRGSFIYLLSAAGTMLQLHVTMLQKQVSVFSIFVIIVYQSLKSSLCSFHMKTRLSKDPIFIKISLSTICRSPCRSYL